MARTVKVHELLRRLRAACPGRAVSIDMETMWFASNEDPEPVGFSLYVGMDDAHKKLHTFHLGVEQLEAEVVRLESLAMPPSTDDVELEVDDADA